VKADGIAMIATFRAGWVLARPFLYLFFSQLKIKKIWYYVLKVGERSSDIYLGNYTASHPRRENFAFQVTLHLTEFGEIRIFFYLFNYPLSMLFLNVRNLVLEIWDWVVWAGLMWLRIGTSGGFVWSGNEPSGSVWNWEILEWLSDWWLLRKASAPWSYLKLTWVRDRQRATLLAETGLKFIRSLVVAESLCYAIRGSVLSTFPYKAPFFCSRVMTWRSMEHMRKKFPAYMLLKHGPKYLF
jgi:hypothetical protein